MAESDGQDKIADALAGETSQARRPPDDSTDHGDSNTISISRADLKSEMGKPGAEMLKGLPAKPGVPPPTATQERAPLKIYCPGCGQKLDVSDLPSFARVGCPSCAAEIIVPKWFETYLLEEPGGVGGMATVYRALDVALDREVAIKVMNSSLATGKQRAKLFLHEARTAATINHPAVIPIYTCGEADGVPYIVMQFMPGGSLDKKLEGAGNALPIPEVVQWLKDIAEGLDNARKHGIIHHDVKPGNILLDGDGCAKIGDFGISQAIFDDNSREVDELIRTYLSPHYVSPEKVLNGSEDYRGDIFSLGATFYHLFTGHTPYDNEDAHILVRERLIKTPAAPDLIRPDLPESISALLLSMMEKKSADRPGYDHIKGVCDECLAAEKRKKVAAKQAKGAAAVKAKNPAKTPAKALASPARNTGRRSASPTLVPRRKRRVKTILAHLTLWAMIAGAGLYLWKSGLFDFSQGSESYEDLLPVATAEFKAGNPANGISVATQAMDHPDLAAVIKKQAALQFALGCFLRNDRDAKQKAKQAKERLEALEIPINDPSLEVLRFLASSEISPAFLMQQVANGGPAAIQAANVAVILRGLFDNSPRMEWVEVCLDYSSNHALTSKHWANAWQGRADAWYNWSVMGKGDNTHLEPLVAKAKADPFPVPKRFAAVAAASAPAAKVKPAPGAKSAVKGKPAAAPSSIAALSAAQLEALRGFAAQRPRPSNFEVGQAAFDAYLAQAPAAQQQMEQERYAYVKDFKGAVARIFGSEQGSVMLKDGRKIEIRMASPKTILTRDSRGSDLRVTWDQIDIRQVIAYIDAYATKLVGMGEYAAGRDFKQDGANCFLALAVFCDWYGQYADAVKYAKRAVELYPKTEVSARELFLR